MIYLAGDNHGFQAIQFVKQYLAKHAIPFQDLGVQQPSEDMPLEVLIPPVVKNVIKNQENKAILSCGTGVGVEVGANKFSGIRASLATNPKVAEYSIVYDNCNVLCLVGWGCTQDSVYEILDAWLNVTYDGDEKRLKMMATFDTWRD